MISKKLNKSKNSWFFGLFRPPFLPSHGSFVEKNFPKTIGFVSPGISFDSVMIQEDELKLGQLRLLEVDNRLLIPIKTHVRLLTTSSDVIHS